MQRRSDVPNTHKVPLRQWRKWHAAERHVFNEVFEVMNKNQLIFLHPKQDSLTPARWRTVAWNAAWTAADAAKDFRKKENSRPEVVVDITPCGKVVREHRVH